MKYRKIIEKDLIIKYIPKFYKTLDIGGENYYDDLFMEIHYCNIEKYNNVNFKRVDLNAKRLPYRNHSFSAILLTQVLEHLENYFSILRESKRILKEGGILFISIPNPVNLIGRLNFMFAEKVSTVKNRYYYTEHKNIVMPYLLRSYIKLLGFTVIYESFNSATIPLIRIQLRHFPLFDKVYTIIAMKK